MYTVHHICVLCSSWRWGKVHRTALTLDQRGLVPLAEHQFQLG